MGVRGTRAAGELPPSEVSDPGQLWLCWAPWTGRHSEWTKSIHCADLTGCFAGVGSNPGGNELGDDRGVRLFHTQLSPQAWCTETCVGVLSVSPCLHQAFFTERYLQEHPEAHEKIEKLKDLIAWQVTVQRQLQGPRRGKGSLGPDPPWPPWHTCQPPRRTLDLSQSTRDHVCPG